MGRDLEGGGEFFSYSSETFLRSKISASKGTKIYGMIIVPIVLRRCKACPLTLSNEVKLGGHVASMVEDKRTCMVTLRRLSEKRFEAKLVFGRRRHGWVNR